MSYDTRGFIRAVNEYWKRHGRHDLPWRHTNAYGVLVSEIMLQQTQVDRVVPYFERWMKKFPTPQRLAKAQLPRVLKEWSGLGYNRRAKLLRECAKEIIKKHGGVVPRDPVALLALPGIGPYTAGAVRAFAFNERDVFIETNIRASLLQHFFPRSKKVNDKKLAPILKACLVQVKSAREWYSALMDYGTHIKKGNPNPSRRSKHYTKQSRFEGSLRQARGAILRQLLKGSISEKALLKIDVENSFRIEMALKDLQKEGLIEKKKARWILANN